MRFREEWQKALDARVREMLKIIKRNGSPSLSEFRLAQELISYLEWEQLISGSEADAWQDDLRQDYLQVG